MNAHHVHGSFRQKQHSKRTWEHILVINVRISGFRFDFVFTIKLIIEFIIIPKCLWFLAFTCEFCAKRYAHKGDLTKHLQTHLGNNIYKCDECGKGFRLLVDLRKHSYEHYKEKKAQSQTSWNQMFEMKILKEQQK